MTLLNDEILSYVGRSSVFELACDAVEGGAVRRYSQAIMDQDPIYWDPEAAGRRYDGPVAPLIFPVDLFRRAFDTQDPVQVYALDPTSTEWGLPPRRVFPLSSRFGTSPCSTVGLKWSSTNSPRWAIGCP